MRISTCSVCADDADGGLKMTDEQRQNLYGCLSRFAAAAQEFEVDKTKATSRGLRVTEKAVVREVQAIIDKAKAEATKEARAQLRKELANADVVEDTPTRGLEYLGYERQYGRYDVDYETWYSDWSKQMAKKHTRDELMAMLPGVQADTSRAAVSHGRIVGRTTSMDSLSQARAQMGNVVRANSERASAITSALEIHDLFPEHAKGGDDD